MQVLKIVFTKSTKRGIIKNKCSHVETQKIIIIGHFMHFHKKLLLFLAFTQITYSQSFKEFFGPEEINWPRTAFTIAATFFSTALLCKYIRINEMMNQWKIKVATYNEAKDTLKSNKTLILQLETKLYALETANQKLETELKKCKGFLKDLSRFDASLRIKKNQVPYFEEQYPSYLEERISKRGDKHLVYKIKEIK